MIKFFAFIIALFVFYLVGSFLGFIGPLLAGLVLMNFYPDPASTPISFETLAASGEIIRLVLSVYLGYRTYKKITRTKE
jgi:hypothetical protein